MDFKLDIDIKKKPPISSTISIPVSESLDEDIQRIKRVHCKNPRIFNELVRQFLSQLVVKFDNGEIDCEPIQDL